MEHKGYYSLTFTADKKPEQIFFDYVNCGVTLDVGDAEGVGVDTDGPDYEIGGSFEFDIEDGELEDIDWDDIEAGFAMFDEDNNPIMFENDKFTMTIYIDGEPKTGEGTTFYSNM